MHTELRFVRDLQQIREDYVMENNPDIHTKYVTQYDKKLVGKETFQKNFF